MAEAKSKPQMLAASNGLWAPQTQCSPLIFAHSSQEQGASDVSSVLLYRFS